MTQAFHHCMSFLKPVKKQINKIKNDLMLCGANFYTCVIITSFRAPFSTIKIITIF